MKTYGVAAFLNPEDDCLGKYPNCPMCGSMSVKRSVWQEHLSHTPGMFHANFGCYACTITATGLGHTVDEAWENAINIWSKRVQQNTEETMSKKSADAYQEGYEKGALTAKRVIELIQNGENAETIKRETGVNIYLDEYYMHLYSENYEKPAEDNKTQMKNYTTLIESGITYISKMMLEVLGLEGASIINLKDHQKTYIESCISYLQAMRKNLD